MELSTESDGDATSVTALCCGSVTLEADQEAISPGTVDGDFDSVNFTVRSSTGKPWELSIRGNTPGPVDERGLPTAGPECTWSASGSESEKTINWKGTCDGGAMVDGQYTAILRSEDQEDSVPIMIDNTAPVFGELLAIPRFDGRMDYSITVQDPLVNGVASGLKDLASLKLQASVDGEDTQLADLRMDAGDFSIASTGGQTYTLRFTYAGANALLLQGIDLLANVGASKQQPNKQKLLKFSCKRDGVRLEQAFDYHRGNVGQRRAITLYFNVDNSLVRDAKNNLRFPYYEDASFLKKVIVQSSLGGGNLVENIQSLNEVNLHKDEVGVATRYLENKQGGKIIQSFVGGRYSDFAVEDINKTFFFTGDMVLILSPDLNLTPHQSQVLTIQIPKSLGGYTVLRILVEKGDNSTWQSVKCL